MHEIGQSATSPLHVSAPPSATQAGVPGVPAVAMPHTPALLQRSQFLSQRLSQHTPSEQNVDWHSAAEMHAPLVQPFLCAHKFGEILQTQAGDGEAALR